MRYNELTLQPKKSKKRIGRGIAAGQGKTAGRGTKGQKSRTGKGRRPGFEGGQNPMMQRIPKLRGFKPFWPKPTTITTGQLNQLEGVVDNLTLYEARLLNHPSDEARVVVRGELHSKVTVALQGASTKAIETIQAAGGSFEKIPRRQQTAAVSDKEV